MSFKYKDNMQEGYLDSNQEYWDYGTSPISGNNIIDTTKTGISFYDDFLNPSDAKYMREEKNLKGEIVKMSPQEYYEECAKYMWPGRNVTVDKLKYERGVLGAKTIEKLKNVLLKYKLKLCMPMINYVDPGQEGLHRMYVIGELYGWDFKVPVLKITYADEDRAKREAEEKRKQEIDWKVEAAIQAALRYKYRNIEEFESQLQWTLSDKFRFWDEIKIPDEIKLIETTDSIILPFQGYEYPIEKDEILWEEPEFEPDDEIEDLIDESDLEETDEILKKYFGDDWRERYPHLKDKFNITESVEKVNTIQTILDELKEFDYAFIDVDGQELDDEEAMNAVVQHPDQFNKLRKGVCTDFVEYTSKKLSEHNIDHDVYFIKCVDKDGDEPSHVFVVVNDEGKFLWIEAAWHSEAGIHKYSSLEKLFEDIARKHCVYEGHNYLKSCEIRKIKKSLAGMSQTAVYDYVNTLPITWKATEERITEELEATQASDIEVMDKAIQEHFGQDAPEDGCIFIHPSGKFINIYPKLDDHEDLCYWLEEKGFGDNPEDASWFVDEFKYIRCRNSLHLCFIELPSQITREQLYSLEEWVETKVSTDYIDIESPNGEWKKYNLDEYFPEDIIKIIKRFYSSGKLYESVDDLTVIGTGIQLRKDLEKGWTRDTCHPSYRDKWSVELPSIGQCAITAMYLNEIMGWDIYETLIGKSRHFFNKDSNGFIYDLTSDQFPNNIDYTLSRKRDFKDLYRSCKNRYELFKSNLKHNVEDEKELKILLNERKRKRFL